MPASVDDALAHYQERAQALLPPEVWHYLRDGDTGANASALADYRLTPRPLRDVRGGHTRLNLFGQELQHPILLAPVAYQRLFHPDGEVASAMAAQAQGGQMLISSLASQPFSAVAAAANPQGDNPPWFQLYWQGDRERSLRLLQRAQAAGCSTVVFTVDAPVKRAILALPADVAAVNLEPGEAPAGDGSRVFDGWMHQAPTWDDVAWLREQTQAPLLLKGLLHPDDAESAVAAGCDGIVVSNHGERVLAGSAISLQALDAVVRQVKCRVPVLFDSGVRSGRDVFVALAHGASAVLLGRPAIWGLGANGALGVAHVLRLMRDGLEMTMALTGCRHLTDIGTHGPRR